MIVFKARNKIYCYIHIPKNNGKYIRSLLREQFEISLDLWGIKSNIDLAHIPKSLYNKYSNAIPCKKFITFLRNPYDRIISAYFYNNPQHTQKHFYHFVINKLPNINFDDFHDTSNIHYYPQHKFIDKYVELINFDQLNNNKSCGSCGLRIKNLNPAKYKYEEYFNNHMISIINDLYLEDIKLTRCKKILNILYS